MTLTHRLLAPGWYRAFLGIALGFGFGLAIVVVVRTLYGWDPIWNWDAIITVGALIGAPLGYLVGIGCFDYWFRWASGAPTIPEDHSGHGAYSWRDYFRVNTDHKVIGIQYICTTFFFFIAGGLMAMLMRAELAQPGTQFVDPNTFNGLFSVHASLMIFLFIIPVFAGIANFVIPLMIGAPDMAFPRLNALSFWMLPAAGVMMLCSYFAEGGAFATGWTAYAPLSTDTPLGQQFFTLGVQFAGASSIATALNFLVTIITMRAPGMTFWRMPLLVWANFTTSLLVVIATPFIAGSQFFVLLDRTIGTHFFDVAQGGDVLMYQHVFWFYSHPAVYIMMLPGFGIISEVISTHARKPVFGYRMMAFSLVAIVILGFTVWAHHMFVSGMQAWIRIPMMITTMLIAVPTGIKIFSWLATLWRGVIHLRTPMLFALGFITMFTLGGISGIMLAVVPFDIHVSDTYFIVAHIHYVLFGGSVFTIFAGIYHWFPKMTGPDVRRDARPAPLLAVVRLLQPHLRPDALRGHRRHAEAGGRLRRAVRDLERDHLDLGVHLRRLVPDLPLQHDRLVAARARSLRATPGGRTRSSGRCPRRRRSSTSTRSRRWSAAPTSTACRARCTRSSRRRSPRARARCPAPAGGGGAPPPVDP